MFFSNKYKIFFGNGFGNPFGNLFKQIQHSDTNKNQTKWQHKYNMATQIQHGDKNVKWQKNTNWLRQK